VSQFGSLDAMQDEIDALAPPVPIGILGINQAGYEAGNATITAGRDAPWLQDTVEQNVWGAWGAQFADVVVLDGCNHLVAVYPAGQKPLTDPTNYDELMALLLAASAAEAH
jgi:hypothetical protein